MTEVKNEKMNRVTVHLDEKPIYDIVMTEDFSALPGEIEKLSISNRRLCIVTDSNVEKLYLNEVKELLAPCCKTVISFVFPAGEEHKNLDTVRDLYETLILNHFDRNDMLAALGGGVGRSLRIRGGDLSARRCLHADSDDASFPGGQQHWRQDGR